MQVSIIAPTKTLYNGEAFSLTVPSQKGSFTALDHHAPIVSVLEKGVVTVCASKDAEPQEFNISSGFVEIHDNVASVCVELA